MGAEHSSSLLYCKLRWLSQGNVLMCFFQN